MNCNEETTSIRDQEDQATLPLTAFNKEKFVAVQQQAPEGMTQPRSFQQCLPQGQTNIPKGLVKRQVIEAWKNMKFNEDIGRMAHECQDQPQQKQEQKVQKKQEQGSKAKKNYIQGRLNNVDMTTTHGAKEVVYGFIPVNSASAIVLFDPSASHSFISSAYYGRTS